MPSTTVEPMSRSTRAPAGSAVGIVNRFGYNATNVMPIKRPATAPARGKSAQAPAEPASAKGAVEPDVPSETAAILAERPVERRRSGGSGTSRRRRSSVRTPLKSGTLLAVDENGQLPEGIDSPPPTPINISSLVAEVFETEVTEANALMSQRVRAKKFDYKGIIQQQSEIIVNLKRSLQAMCDKSAEARDKSLSAQEVANSKVQSLALEKKPLREQIIGLSTQLESLRDLHSETAAARSDLQARHEALTTVSESDRAALEAAAARVELTEEELTAEKERADDAETRFDRMAIELEDAEKHISALAEKLRVSGIEHEKQLDILRESSDRRSVKQAVEHETIETELRTGRDAAVAALQAATDELRVAVAERAELRARVLQLDESTERLEAECSRTSEALATVRVELSKKEADLSESLRNISRMQTEAIERQAELRDEKKELADRLDRAIERAERGEEGAARAARELLVLEAELRTVDSSDAHARQALARADGALLEAQEGLCVAQSELTILKQEHGKVLAAERAASAANEASTCELAVALGREEAMRAELDRVKTSAHDVEVEFRTYKAHCGSSNMEQMGALVQLQRQCEALNARFEETRGQLGVREGETHVLQAEVAARAQYVAELEAKLRDAEETRRKLHNTVQELKGNIRVFCRVRPTTAEDGICLDLKPDGTSVNIATVSAGEKCARESAHAFTFDKVFSAASSQADVFGEVSSLVQSALDGYKVCIFAYGQTGSGKTFTMQGTSDPTNCGIVPRSLKQIFMATTAAKDKGWTYALHASFIEVYNENVRDLLAPPGAVAGSHSIVHDEAFGTVVTDVTRIEVTAEAQVDELARAAARQRSVSATDMNSVSSRSHAIFMLYLTGERRAPDRPTAASPLRLCRIFATPSRSQRGAPRAKASR
jgi:hypothetical protein